jgi:hypothetical protein
MTAGNLIKHKIKNIIESTSLTQLILLKTLAKSQTDLNKEVKFSVIHLVLEVHFNKWVILALINISNRNVKRKL